MPSILPEQSTKESQFTSKLTRRRKAKLNTYFREECEDCDVTGNEKVALSARFMEFLDKRMVEEEEGGDIFMADQRAWEEFRTKYFPHPPLYMKVQLNSLADNSHNSPSSRNVVVCKPKPVPVRKPGWRREPDSLLKEVLVSNATGRRIVDHPQFECANNKT